MNIIRYDECNSRNMILEISGKIFRCSFCRNCGQYTNKDYLNILCSCDTRSQIFEDYKNFILEIPDDFSGDELEDFMEVEDSIEPNKVKSSMLKHIYSMILFGMTYEKNYYNRIDEYISNNVLSFLC
jgi:hypothetical protein